MRNFCFFVLVFGCPFLWVGCDTLSQTANAQPQTPSRMEARPLSQPQANNPQVELANLRADVQILDRRLREMSNALEDMVERNRRLVAEMEQVKRLSSQPTDGVRQAVFDQVIQELRQQIHSANSEQRRQILREVTQQIEALGSQTQAAIDALARNISSRPTTTTVSRPPSFSEDFPKEGISYTVKAGDTLSGIASRHNSTIRDIQNANQISNPASIQIGQTLFIPQRNP